MSTLHHESFCYRRAGKTSFADVPEPSPGDGDVLLRVRTVGYCGTDLSTFRGVNPLVSYPRIPGHELGCTIAAIGSAVPQENSASARMCSCIRTKPAAGAAPVANSGSIAVATTRRWACSAKAA